MSWTEQRTETAVFLFKAGHSAAQIAKQLGGVTRNAVLGKLWRLGHKREAPARPAAAKPTRIRTMRAAVPPALPQAVVPFKAFDPLPNTEPRPWEQRRGGCSWPVGGDGLSCCEPVEAFGWCATHRRVGRRPLTAHQQRIDRIAR